MKVDSVNLPMMPPSQMDEMPVIKADAIKAILYLGIKGEIKLDAAKTHTVDTYA